MTGVCVATIHIIPHAPERSECRSLPALPSFSSELSCDILEFGYDDLLTVKEKLMIAFPKLWLSDIFAVDDNEKTLAMDDLEHVLGRGQKFHIHIEGSFFQRNVFPSFVQSMRRDWSFTDTAIVTDDGSEVRCHRALLSASSPLFRAKLYAECVEGMPLRVEMAGSTAHEVNVVLQFLYRLGLPADTDAHTCIGLLQIGAMYEISGMFDVCVDLLRFMVRKDTVVDILQGLSWYREVMPIAADAFAEIMDWIRDDCVHGLLEAVCTQSPRVTQRRIDVRLV